MQTATIKIKPWDARSLLRKSREEIAEYRKQLRSRKFGEIESARQQMEKEDQEMNAIYREISQGRQVLNLFETFRLTGCNELGLPKLAIARADQLKVFCVTYANRCDMYTGDRWRGPRSTRFSIGAEWLPGLKSLDPRHEAIVPIIPVRFRPKSKLLNYHILFEAEWRRAVPVDPILLRHIGGVHYSVLAHWDLTEVERAALFGRLV